MSPKTDLKKPKENERGADLALGGRTALFRLDGKEPVEATLLLGAHARLELLGSLPDALLPFSGHASERSVSPRYVD